MTLPPGLNKTNSGSEKNETTDPPKSFVISSDIISGSERIIIYGPGGIGKTTLASQINSVIEKPALFLDVEGGSGELKVERIDSDQIRTFNDLRLVLNEFPGWDDYGAIVIDSLSRVEEMWVEHVLETVPVKGGKKAKSINDYGWSEGYTHTFDQALILLSDLDRHIREGRHIILIAHEEHARVPHPESEDYTRWEPRIMVNKKAPIRNRYVEWASHLFRIGYDIAVVDGKAKGGGTRSIYTAQMPTFMAKSRTLSKLKRIPFKDEHDPTLWNELLG